MAGVGGIACDFVRGFVSKLSERTKVWQVPGHDGFGVEALGLGADPEKLTLVKFGTTAEVVAWHDSLRDISGQLITIVTDFGETSVVALLQKVGSLDRKPAQFEGGVRGETSITVLAM